MLVDSSSVPITLDLSSLPAVLLRIPRFNNSAQFIFGVRQNARMIMF